VVEESISKSTGTELIQRVAAATRELAAMTAELERRANLAERHDVPADPVRLVGPEEACRILGMTKRRLYALERAHKLPFAKSRSQKDRAYAVDEMAKWVTRQTSKAA
jgi:hypothetical protein